jgi:hypothetical protein
MPTEDREWELGIQELCLLRDDALDRADWMGNSILGCPRSREDFACLYQFAQAEFLYRVGPPT